MWLAENLFNLSSAIGVIGGLLFTAHSLRSEARTRREANLLTITANHREVWTVFLTVPAVARVNDPSADISKQPVTIAELISVNMVIQHINSVYRAMDDQLIVNIEGLRRDVAQFLSLPIPRAVWEKVRVVQNDDFVVFVESCLNWK